MARVKIQIPTTVPIFSCSLEIRITDVNYGGHMGNDAVLRLVHEARVLLLRGWGMTELEAGGCGITMGDAELMYQADGYAGDVLQVEIYLGETTRVSWELIYVLSTKRNDKSISVATVKTGMVCYNYISRKVQSIPHLLKEKLGIMS